MSSSPKELTDRPNPADEQGNFGNVKSSDEDPYGDPADEEQNNRRR